MQRGDLKLNKRVSMGRHLILEVYQVKSERLNDLHSLTSVLEKGILRSKMTILNTFTHQFTPQGVTILFALAESHVSVHTFPELESLTADAYTCGEGDPKIILNLLLQYCDSMNYQFRDLYR